MEEKKKMDDNVVYVGIKEPKQYSFAVKTIFGKGQKEVIVKSRGKSILRAIDVVEFLKRNESIKVKVMEIGSDEFEVEGRKIMVSTISLTLTK